MKTIFIDSLQDGSDFMMDALWTGFVEKLGYENIIDFPHLKRHRNNVFNTYAQQRASLGYTQYWDKFHDWSIQEILDLIMRNQIERVIVDDTEKGRYYFRVLKLHESMIPVIVIAGWDRLRSHINTIQKYYEPYLEAIFIDNWLPEYRVFKKAHPINYAINFDHLWQPKKYEKTIDVSFIGKPTTLERETFYLALKDLPNTYLRCDNSAEMLRHNYFEIIAQSKISINLKGKADNGKTLRFYEIPYVGTFMLSEYQGYQITPLMDKTHCCYFETIEQMINLIRWALNNERAREIIAEQGHNFVMRNCTSQARVEYIYQCLKSC